MTSKVLVVIDDGEVRIHHTPGVDVICIVDGENMQLPIDWTGKLTHEIKHTMPIEVRFSEMFREEGDESDVILEDGIHVVQEETSVSLGSISQESAFGQLFTTKRPIALERHSVSLMKAPYCMDCGDNHPPGPCPDPEPCQCCKRLPGEKHAVSCSNKNPGVPGGDIVR